MLLARKRQKKRMISGVFKRPVASNELMQTNPKIHTNLFTVIKETLKEKSSFLSCEFSDVYCVSSACCNCKYILQIGSKSTLDLQRYTSFFLLKMLSILNTLLQLQAIKGYLDEKYFYSQMVRVSLD